MDLSQFITHETLQEALLAIVALLLKSAVKLLHKIHSIFLDLQSSSLAIQSKLEGVSNQNKHIMFQNEEMGRKLSSIHEQKVTERAFATLREARKAAEGF